MKGWVGIVEKQRIHLKRTLKEHISDAPLKRTGKGYFVDAEQALEELSCTVFAENRAEHTVVLSIQTNYNDYKKLCHDLQESEEEKGRKAVKFNKATCIEDLVKIEALRKYGKKYNLFGRVMFSNVASILGLISSVIAIIEFAGMPNGHGLNMSFPAWLALILLSVLLWVIRSYSVRQENRVLRNKIEELPEEKSIAFFREIGLKGSKLKGDQVFFVENLSLLKPACRSYIIAYLEQVEYCAQMWCVIDYNFEDSLKIEKSNKNISYKFYDLVPLKYKEKERIYREYELYNSISKEYLTCIGVDALWNAGSFEEDLCVKLYSAEYISQKMRAWMGQAAYGQALMEYFYCLVYLSAKYRYSFSVSQMASLIMDEEKVGRDFLDTIPRFGGERAWNRREVQLFLNKIIELLEGYYFDENIVSGGKRVKSYRFSYDILEGFHEKMEECYPDTDTVQKWILTKLIGNEDIFGRQEQYLYNCSNLLIMMKEKVTEKEFCILANRLLRILNEKQCWCYYAPILKTIYFLERNECSMMKYVQRDIMKDAVCNNMLYICDEDSMGLAMVYLAGAKEEHFPIYNFFDGTLMESMGRDNEFAIFLSWLLEIFYKRIFYDCDIRERQKDIAFTEIGKARELQNIFFQLTQCCVMKEMEWEACYKNVSMFLTNFKSSSEAKVLAMTVAEILKWIKSEKERDEERNIRRINVDLLMETTDSNTLRFLCGCLYIVMIKEKECPLMTNNSLLNFILKGMYYFIITSEESGIGKYMNELYSMAMPRNVKIPMVLQLLLRGAVKAQEIQELVLNETEYIQYMIHDNIKNLVDSSEIEEFVCMIMILQYKIKDEGFTEKIFSALSMCLAQMKCYDGNMLIKYIRIAWWGDKNESSMKDTVNEMNHIKNASLLVWLFNECCEQQNELVEWIPFIRKDVWRRARITAASNLLSKYLKRHSYYDCDREILDIYLKIIREDVCPSKWITLRCLDIIDTYAEDNENIKMENLDIYNRLIELYFWYESMGIYKEMDMEFPKHTLEFLIKGMENLRRSKHKESLLYRDLAAYDAKRKQKNIKIEKIIDQHFKSWEPIMNDVLSLDYYWAMCYFYDFPEMYQEMKKK